MTAPSHTLFFTRELLTKINMAAILHPPYLSVSPLWHNWGNPGRIAGSAEHPHKTRFPGWI
jgi:hypothetical protein